ncbi:hypothetical protein B0I08_10844 [Glaciihabitans tibetensis]|uniref:DUF3592 domain-containing protein n=1 Tax=Glaciihabitans tibetensis TaxID=1266600 RepID=A0A2T0V9Z3_9MICO|nr:DUF3592 domain-containing protein [Glaciihabitans tibetensis]PRY66961.1 hypothetical protein B0I08_10844 [Glaciihabitans tibetensis]
MTIRDLIDLLAELFGWFGILAAAGCFLVVAILRLSRGHWEETEAVVVDNADSSQIRWMTAEGVLHTRTLDPHDRAAIADPEELHIYYSRRAPDHIRFDVAGHGEKVLRALGFSFLGLGIVAFAISLIALFVPS